MADAAAPTPGGQGAQPGAVEGQPDSQTSIPPPPKGTSPLPGVAPDISPDITEFTDEITGVKMSRDPKTGRFLPRGQVLPGVKADAGAGAKADAADVPPKPGDLTKPPPVPKFKFGGIEWDTQEAAEQNFKSLRGQFKPLVERTQTAETNLAKAAESARAWKAEADRVSAELAKYSQQPADATTGPEAEESPVDWELYAEVKRLADAQGEPWKAEQWLIEQTRKADDGRIRSLIRESLKPLQDHYARQQVGQQVEGLFETMADYADAAGNPAFPELSDVDAAYEVGQLWTQMGFPADLAMTPQGVAAAVALYRMQKGSQGSQASAPPPPPVTQAPPGPAPSARAAASLDDGRPAPSTGAAESNLSPEAVRLLAGLKSAHLALPGLGFER